MELHRLVKIAQAYDFMNKGDDFFGAGDIAKANDMYGTAASMAPQIVEMRFWQAVTLASNNQLELSLPIFKEVFAKEPFWREMIPRLVKANQFNVEKSALDKVLAQ